MPRSRDNDDNNALRTFRVAAGHTQDSAADALGVSRSTWSSWELKERPMSVAHLNRIKLALKLTDEEAENIRKWWGDACHTQTQKKTKPKD